MGWPRAGEKGIRALEWIKKVAQEVWSQRYRDVHKENMRNAKERAGGARDEDPDDDAVAAANWLEAETNSEFENGSDEGHNSSE